MIRTIKDVIILTLAFATAALFVILAVVMAT